MQSAFRSLRRSVYHDLTVPESTMQALSTFDFGHLIQVDTAWAVNGTFGFFFSSEPQK